jgi:phage gpG-like protein
MSDFTKLKEKINKLKKYVETHVPTIVGVEAVNHFKESFDKGGFTGDSFQPWENSKRRDSSSKWYGFQYKGEKQVKGAKKANTSEAAKSRPTLTGESLELANAIDWIKTGNTIKIIASKAYSKIHNEGGTMKVFGKATTTMPKRQFIGASSVLKAKIEKIIEKDIKKILDK